MFKNLVKRIGTIIACLDSLELRVAALEAAIIVIESPSASFDMEGVLDASLTKEFNVAISFKTETKMEVWVI